MKTMEFHHHDLQTTAPKMAITSTIMYVLAWVFNLVSELSPEIVWIWTWRGLSLLSLLLIIYINWNKACDILKKKKVKHEQD